MLQALNKAEEEEQFLKSSAQRATSNKWCDLFKMKNHDTSECGKNKFSKGNIYFNSEVSSSNNRDQSQFNNNFNLSQNAAHQFKPNSNPFQSSNFSQNFHQQSNPSTSFYQNPNYNTNYQNHFNPNFSYQGQNPNFNYQNYNPSSFQNQNHPDQFQSNFVNQVPKKICTYCRMHNHVIDTCRKLQKQQHRPTNYNHNSNAAPNYNANYNQYDKQQKYCNIHNSYGSHNTEECFLKNQFRGQNSNQVGSNVCVCSEQQQPLN